MSIYVAPGPVISFLGIYFFSSRGRCRRRRHTEQCRRRRRERRIRQCRRRCTEQPRRGGHIRGGHVRRGHIRGGNVGRGVGQRSYDAGLGSHAGQQSEDDGDDELEHLGRVWVGWVVLVGLNKCNWCLKQSKRQAFIAANWAGQAGRPSGRKVNYFFWTGQSRRAQDFSERTVWLIKSRASNYKR